MMRFADLPLALILIPFLGFHVRDMGPLQGCLAGPQTTVFGEDAYTSLSLKGPALLHSLVTTHPMVDGNKRTGWALLLTFLQLNKREIPASTDGAFSFNLSVANGRFELEGIAEWIEARLVPAGTD